MLTRRFNRLFRRLVSAFLVYDDAPRSVERLAELAQARMQLDDARTEIAAERAVVLQQRQRSTPVNRTAVSDHDLAVLRVQGMISY